MEHGHTDTDMGLKNAFAEMEKLKSMCVKVGVTEDVGAQPVEGSNVTLAQIASWNELGVLAKDRGVKPTEPYGEGKWFIPPRPFIRGFIDGKREQIAQTIEKIGKLVMDGKITAEVAMARLGEYGASGVKSYIRNGVFTPNAEATIARKESTKPLIDTGTLRNSIRYQVIHQPASAVTE